jgi:uncharacterized protein
MPPEIAAKSVALIPNGCIPVFGLIGGEPMSRWKNTKRIMDAVRAACAERGLSTPIFSMTTGGTSNLDHAKMAARLIHSFTVSLDGPKGIHDAQRGKGSYNQTMGFLKAVRDVRGRVRRLRATIDPGLWGNDLPIERVFLRLAEICSKGLAGGLAIEIAANRTSEGFNPTDAIRRAVALYRRFKEKGYPPIWHEFEQVNKRIEHTKRTPEITPRCGAVRDMVSVAQDGGIWPCHRKPGLLPIGDVSHGFNKEALSGWWDTILKARSSCIKCSVWAVCRGGCPAEDENGAISKGACMWRKTFIEAILEG